MLDYLNEFQDNPDEALYYLEVSDYNTNGMNFQGDESIDENSDNGFYSFVRCAGLSSKSTTSAGGSFGFGKAAYFMTSKIRTLIVSTKTISGRYFFEGVSSLCTHNYNGRKCVPVGYYDNNDGKPVSSLSNIPSRYQREDDASGTSVFIMGIDVVTKEEIDSVYEEIKKAVLLHFWLSIYSGKLVVDIEYSKNDILTISKDNVVGVVEELYPDFDDAKRGHNNPRPYLDAVHNADKDSKHIHKILSVPKLGDVDLYILKSKSAKDKILKMRSPRMLVCATPNNSSYGFYGVLVCDTLGGNTWLRKMENPAHTEWDYKNAPKEQRKDAKGVFNNLNAAVQDAIKDIFTQSETSVLNIRGLEEYLYIPTAEDNDSDDDIETALGIPTGKFQEQGTSPTTDTDMVASMNAVEQKPAVGQVLIGEPAYATPVEDGSHMSGHTSRPRKTHGGGGAGSIHPTDRVKVVSTTEEGKAGSYAYPLPINYRSFAQMQGERVIHKLIVRSDYDVEDGQIMIMSVGENDNESVKIKSAVSTETGEKIKIVDNCLCGIKLHIGKNEIELKFADNMKHAVILEAYENK